MKNFGKLALLGAALAVSATSVYATPIVLTGTLTVNGGTAPEDTFNGSSISFLPASPSSNAVIHGATGNLATLVSINEAATMTNFNSSSVNTDLLSVADAPTDLTFEEFSIASWVEVVDPVYGDSLTIKGTGEFTDSTGDIPAIGTFILTSSSTSCTSGANCTASDVGFTFTPSGSVTPEPSSLMLLGTGLVSGAGMLMRRRRLTA